VNALAFSAISPTQWKFALGTTNSLILDLTINPTAPNTNTKPVSIMAGHRGEVWGLDVHPNKPWVISGAYDSKIRIWDHSKKAFIPGKIVTIKDLKVRAVTFSPSGNMFAVGLDDGSVFFYDSETMEKKGGKKYKGELIDALVYSPDGKVLAAGSWDQSIDLIDSNNYHVLHTLKGHTSSVTHLTFSSDSKYLVSNSKDYDVLFWNVATGKREKDSAVSETEWDHWTCVLGWPVVGIFEAGEDGTDVNFVSVSGDSKSEYRVIALGDDSQRVELLRFPALTPKGHRKSFVGHASHVTRVRFNPDSSLLFSTGGNDEMVFQWRHIPDIAPASG